MPSLAQVARFGHRVGNLSDRVKPGLFEVGTTGVRPGRLPLTALLSARERAAGFAVLPRFAGTQSSTGTLPPAPALRTAQKDVRGPPEAEPAASKSAETQTSPQPSPAPPLRVCFRAQPRTPPHPLKHPCPASAPGISAPGSGRPMPPRQCPGSRASTPFREGEFAPVTRVSGTRAAARARFYIDGRWQAFAYEG